MLFTVRHKTYAGQVLDVLIEANSSELAGRVATAWCKQYGHWLVSVKATVVADESILAPPVAVPSSVLTYAAVQEHTLTRIPAQDDAASPAPATVVQDGPTDRMAAARAAKAAKKGAPPDAVPSGT